MAEKATGGGGTKPPPKKPAKKAALKPRRKPLGTALAIVQKQQRARVIGMRRVQGLTWDLIAREVGLTSRQCKLELAAYERDNPDTLDFFKADPVKLFQEMMSGIYYSISDFEGLAFAALEQGNLAAAVGAKKAATDAREKIVEIERALGLLPQDLATFRTLFDLREIASRTIDLVEAFERGEATPTDVRQGFYDMLGVETEEESVSGEIAA